MVDQPQINLVRGLPRRTLLALLIPVAVAITAAAHWPALSAHALWMDDNQYLTDNALVQHPSWQSARRFLSEVFTPSTVQGYYQPLTMISLMLDVTTGGGSDNLRPFHRTSLILHLANTGLVILLLYSLFGDPWSAAAIGLLFGLHPLTVEPIPWVGERKTLLASFFALIALVAYVRYAEMKQGEGESGRGGEGARRLHTPHSTLSTWYFVCMICYLLALLSKPTTTTLPLVMLLLDYWPLNRLSWRSVREKVPFLMLAVVFAIITVVSQARTAEITLPQHYPRWGIPMIMCHNIVFYLYKIVWPVHLIPYYIASMPFNLSNPVWRWGLIGTGMLLAVLGILWRWSRVPLTCWLMFFVAIFPTMGVIGFTGVLASDKYVYLPSVGLLIGLAWLLCRCVTGGTLSRAGAGLLVILLAGTEFGLTRHAYAKWQETIPLFRQVLKVAPTAGIVNNNLANYLMRKGEVQEALEHYRMAMKYTPNFAVGFHNYGRAIYDQGQVAEAIQYYKHALEIKSDYPDARLNLGIALLQTGELAAAAADYQELLAKHPDFAAAHHNLANVLINLGPLEQAVEHEQKALQLQPDYPEAHVNLANTFLKMGKYDEAMSHLKEGLRLMPDWYFVHYSLADALTAQGKTHEAIAAYRRAIELKPDYALAHNDLANALAREGDIDGAIVELREALRLDPKYQKAMFNLATLLLQKGQDAEAVEHYEQVLKLQPEYPTAHSNLGAALERMGRLEEALQHDEEALRQKPDYVDARYNRAVALQRMGRLDEAIAGYEAVLKAVPAHAEAKAALDAARTKRDNATSKPL